MRLLADVGLDVMLTLKMIQFRLLSTLQTI